MPRGFLRFLRSNTLALLALFIALGGTTYAATALPKNSVGTKQLKKNAVTAVKIKNGNVTNGKIGKNAVTGAKVKDNSLTGADVLESSLATVPSATNATHATTADTATNANALGGVGPNGYQKVPATAQHYTIPATALLDQDAAGRAEVTGNPLELCTQSGGDRLQAAVHLPQGVTVTNWAVDYRDDSGAAGSNGQTWLTRVPLFGKGGAYADMFTVAMANTATAGATASVNTSTPFGPTAGLEVIDNTRYAYTVITAPAGAAAVCSLNITYTVPQGFAATAHTLKPSGGKPSNG
jgi:hypothetical protein